VHLNPAARESAIAQAGQPFATVDAGQGPNVVMERTFTAQGGAGAGCPSLGSDAFWSPSTRL